MVKHTHIQWRDSHTRSDWAEEKFLQYKGKSLLLTTATLFQTFRSCHLLSGYGIIWEPVCNGKWYRVLDRGPVIINNVNTSKGMRMSCRVKRIRIFMLNYFDDKCTAYWSKYKFIFSQKISDEMWLELFVHEMFCNKEFLDSLI